MNRQASVPSHPRLTIHKVSRFPQSDPSDELAFSEGVNVLVGVPNTGKSKWLRMLDFVLGSDKRPSEVLPDDLVTKYTSIRAELAVGGQSMIVTRRWDDDKFATRIQVDDGEWMAPHAFSLKLMEATAIPVLHYPQGNPYGVRSWPELGWRSLMRHIYRRQDCWGDLADRQPESEQHACILQFVGIAERLFSKEYGELVTCEKRIQRLDSDRERFVEMLQEISRDLIDEKELGVAMTPSSIAEAIGRQEQEIAALQDKKETVVRQAVAMTTTSSSNAAMPSLSGQTARLGEQLAVERARRVSLQTSLRKTQSRLEELDAYRATLESEHARLQRAAEAGTLLADLKITHCPACDRKIAKPDEALDHCYLCQRPNQATPAAGAEDRLKFELQQLKGELGEALTLIKRVRTEYQVLLADELKAGTRAADLEDKLRPATAAVTAVVVPELAVLDQDIGRLGERIAQLRRVEATLARRESIAKQIEDIQTQVAELEKTVADQTKLISFETASDLLTDGMNTYLNAINEVRPETKPWTQDRVDVRLRERGFNIRVGKNDWRVKLGGTLSLYFLIAYHYSLFTLSRSSVSHFPGLCILDFPAELNGMKVSDAENFVLEPFVRLFASGTSQGQVIAAGSSFAGLEGASRISLEKVWK